ncbi:MAG TPA: hypothetical protein VK453_24505 [Micromonosporaceae bacterium]|nr:hypothetical protein [Micromonosporaceae bacterium]
MAELTPQQRSMRARAAAHTRWSKESPDLHLPKARAAFMDRFAKQVDPDGVLPEAERQRRAGQARTAYFTALAYQSSRARAARTPKRVRPAAPSSGREGTTR